MTFRVNLDGLIRWLAVACAVFLISACASGLVDHSFGFNVEQDNQGAEVLDYKYGESKLPVRAPEEDVRKGRVFIGTTVGGRMLRGDFLYVKWRIKSTGAVYEDKVDLRHRLPRDLENKTVYFMVRGPQLYVYLISPEPRPTGAVPIGPSAYYKQKIIQIYPDQPKQ